MEDGSDEQRSSTRDACGVGQCKNGEGRGVAWDGDGFGARFIGSGS
jgi:hypothetical protein